jgi:hypothetical protein
VKPFGSSPNFRSVSLTSRWCQKNFARIRIFNFCPAWETTHIDKATIWRIGTPHNSFLVWNWDSERQIMVQIWCDRRGMRVGFNSHIGRSDVRCGRWRNRGVYPTTFTIARPGLAAHLLSLTVAGMRPVMAMRMTKPPQEGTKRTSFDSIAKAQKPDDGKRQKQPG